MTSLIEWTDETWNPVVGCSVVSPGCKNCYAMRMAGTRLRETDLYRGLTQQTKAGPVWTGETRVNETALLAPLRWKKPRMVFVNSMGDLFHPSIPDRTIDRVFAVMALAPQHTFQILTKQAERMREYFESGDMGIDRAGLVEQSAIIDFGKDVSKAWPLPNVWLGVSAEDQRRADERIPALLDTPAAIHFVSAEPLLGPIDLTKLQGGIDEVAERPVLDSLRGLLAVESVAQTGIGTGEHLRRSAREGRGSAEGADAEARTCAALKWIITGGESGPGARPMHPDWPRGLRDQCAAADVPFFFKQWGVWTPDTVGRRVIYEFEDSVCVARTDKKSAGRLLDGREHKEMPEGR